MWLFLLSLNFFFFFSFVWCEMVEEQQFLEVLGLEFNVWCGNLVYFICLLAGWGWLNDWALILKMFEIDPSFNYVKLLLKSSAYLVLDEIFERTISRRGRRVLRCPILWLRKSNSAENENRPLQSWCPFRDRVALGMLKIKMFIVIAMVNCASAILKPPGSKMVALSILIWKLFDPFLWPKLIIT